MPLTQRIYVSQVDIAAPPDVVWAALVELSAYPEWNPFTVAAESTLEVGAPIDLTVRMSRLGLTLRQREIVSRVEPPSRLDWSMKLGSRRLLSGARTQTLTALADGGTRYRTEDAIEGALAPVVALIFGGSLEDGFAAMAQALAARAERR